MSQQKDYLLTIIIRQRTSTSAWTGAVNIHPRTRGKRRSWLLLWNGSACQPMYGNRQPVLQCVWSEIAQTYKQWTGEISRKAAKQKNPQLCVQKGITKELHLTPMMNNLLKLLHPPSLYLAQLTPNWVDLYEQQLPGKPMWNLKTVTVRWVQLSQKWITEHPVQNQVLQDHQLLE